MRQKKYDLRSIIVNSSKILMFAKECYLYSKYLNSPQSQQEIEYISKSFDYRFISYLSWRVTIIELAKLISPSNHDSFSIIRLIKFLKKGSVHKAYNLDEKMISNWGSILKQKEQIFLEILEARNEVYAHSSNKEYNSKDTKVTFTEIREIIEFCENVLSFLSRKCFQEEIRFFNPTFNPKTDILAALSDHHARKMEDIRVRFVRQFDKRPNP
jgi:AbiU2